MIDGLNVEYDEQVPTKSECTLVSEDGKWGLVQEDGYEGGVLWALGKYGYWAGGVMNAENFEAAIYEAECELNLLAAEYETYGISME